MTDEKLMDAARALVKSMNRFVDENLPSELAEIVKTHSKGAAIAGVAGGWIPGVGGSAAILTAAGFVWTMYGRINSAIQLPFSENVLKSVASGVATNIAAYAAGSVALSTAFSIFPGLGNVAASVIAGGTSYALTLASGYVYLKVLTRLFQSGKDPTSISAEELNRTAKKVVEQEDMKAVMREAKQAYKKAKASGKIK